MSRETRPASARTIAGRIGSTAEGDAGRMLVDVCGLADAGPDHLSYLQSLNDVGNAEASGAGCLIVPRDLPEDALAGRTVIRHDDPQSAFIHTMLAFRPPRSVPDSGVSLSAWVAPSARLGEDVCVRPNATIGEDARVGDRTVVHPGVVIGAGATIGEDCVLHAGVVVGDDCMVGDRVILHPNTVLGSDGFGYRPAGGTLVKTPHTGRVVLGDDVELGACVTVDRGMIGDTVIGEGTKIDNLVQVAHNVEIGRHNVLAAQVGIAGSSSTGDWVQMGGQAGVADHTVIGTGVQVGAKAAVMSNVGDGSAVHGMPARPAREQMRILSSLGRLPQMRQQLKRLQATVDELSGGETSESVADDRQAA